MQAVSSESNMFYHGMIVTVFVYGGGIAMSTRARIVNFYGAQESIPPAYVAWLTGTTILLLLGS